MGRLTFILSLALAGSTAQAGAGSALVLRWEAVPGAKEYVLEIAEDTSFERVVLKKRVPNAAYRFVPPSAEVSYFFRVAAVDNLGRLGRVSRAVPIQQVLSTPTVIGPADGAEIDHVGPPPTVTLRWKSVADAAEYRVEIASARDFSDATPKKVSTTALTWRPPELGTFYWRVVAVDKSGLAGRTSPIRSFLVRTGPPRLRRPRSNALVAFQAPTTQVALRWSSGPAKRFDIHVATDAAFRRPRKLTSNTEATTVEITEPRKWHWRVRAVDADGKTSPWSSPGSFEMRAASMVLEAPPEGAELTTSEATATVAFAWTAVVGAKSYALTLIDADGEEERIESREPTITAKLPVGSRTWSVTASDKRRQLVAFSGERRVIVSRRLAAPRLVAPEQNSSVLLLAPGDPEIEVAWQPVPGASAYEIEVADSAAFDAPQRKEAAAERATLSIARPGDTFWRIRAVGGEWSETRTLSIAPRARRAEIILGGQSAGAHAVTVKIVDEAGAGVPGLPLTGSATAGALTPFDDRGDGSYVATWSGDVHATVSAAGPFDLRASAEIGAATPTLFAGAKVGILTNFTADASPRFQAQGLYRLPWLERRLFVLAALGYAYSGKSFTDVVDVAANLHRVPITLAVGYRFPLAWFELYGTAGAALDPFVGTVSVDDAPFESESGLVAGVDVAAGASYPLGPGDLFAELAFRATSSWDGLFSIGGPAFVITAGYNMPVF